MAITIIGTYFTTKEPKHFLGGWEEIVIFEKTIEKWKERKRLMYIKY